MAVEKNIEVKLRKVRLSFCDLFEPIEGKDDKGAPNGKFSYSASVLLDKVKDADKIKLIRQAMADAKKAQWGASGPVIPADRLCLKDGEPIDPDTIEHDGAGNPIPGTGKRVPRYDGYEGQMVLTANRGVKSKDAPNPLQLFGPRRTAKDTSGNPMFPTLTEADGMLYSGAWVDVIVKIYGFDGSAKNYPNRINASLEAVKFSEHGNPFGAKKVDAQSAFDEEDEEPEDDDGLGTAASGSDDDMGI